MKMRRLTILLALGLTLLALVALAGGVSAADPVTIQIKTQNNSGQSGTATLTDLGNGTTKVVVDLANSPAGPQPIHIHAGTCANLTPQPKFNLTNMANGKSETTVNVALADILASPHSINVHKSTTEAAVYVACGEVVAAVPVAAPRTGGGGMTNSFPSSWLAIAALLTVVVAGASVVLRRRAA